MILRAAGVQKRYLQGTDKLEILRGVDLEINEPQTVAIMGRSGCGKSTFITLLAGLDAPDEGRIEILDKNLAALGSRELNAFRAHKIGIIFQQFHLLDHLTAFENARLPLDLSGAADGDARAAAMVEKVGLGHRGHHFPDQLSRGECQRVAIARVLVMEPKLLLADEPTGSLDVKTGRDVIDLIFRLAASEKFALVMATHDPKVAERCSRIYYMDAGRLSTERPVET